MISLISMKCILKYSVVYNNHSQTAISEVWHFTYVEKGGACANKNITPHTHTHFFIEVSVPRQEIERSCMCLIGVLPPFL